MFYIYIYKFMELLMYPEIWRKNLTILIVKDGSTRNHTMEYSVVRLLIDHTLLIVQQQQKQHLEAFDTCLNDCKCSLVL